MSTKTFDDPTEHIQTQEDFEREVRALTVRAERAGGYLPLVEGPITTLDAITDDVLDALAGATPDRADIRQPRFLLEAKMRDWWKQDALDPAAEREELTYRRDQLRVTLTKLWRRGRDVSTIINTLARAPWYYLLLVAHRGPADRPLRADRRHPRTRLQVEADRALKAAVDALQKPRPTRKTEQALTAAMDAMQALLLYHVDADRLVRPIRGPGTLEEFLSGETTHAYSESEPARRYLSAMHGVQDIRRALRTGSATEHHLGVVRHALEDARRAMGTDARLRAPARLGRLSNKAAHHQLFLRVLRTRLHSLGVSHSDITTLLRATGLLALTRADRPDWTVK